MTSRKQRTEEIEEFTRLSLTLGSALTVDQILGAIVDSCLKLCQAERAAILLYGPTSKELAKTLVRRSEESIGEIDHKLNLIVAGWIERNKRPFITPDIIDGLELKNPSEEWRRLGPAIAVPLIISGEIIGIINLVNSRGGMPFTDDVVGIATYISALAAQFIHRSKLHETLFENNLRLKTALKERYGILGQSRATQVVMERVAIAASSTATVLITGETGTGKELVARAIHYGGDRADKPFVAINCAAIPAALFESELFGHERGAFTGASEARKGKFELANQGTVFLDEISEMPLDLQPKLLRVLESRKFYRLGSSAEVGIDVRVVAAGSKDLGKAIEEGKFRDDLFYRLNVISIHLSPLRERPDEIPVLAQAFLEEFSGSTKRFTPEALELLRTRQWRGNVRELRNMVERVSIFAQRKDVGADDIVGTGSGIYSRAEVFGSNRVTNAERELELALEALVRRSGRDSDLMEVVEKNLIRLALREAKNNVAEASRILGVDHMALRRRIEKYHL